MIISGTQSLAITHVIALLYWCLRFTNAPSQEVASFSLLVCNTIIMNLCMIYVYTIGELILPIMINFIMFFIFISAPW